jgi:kynurenine formamidase
MKKINLLIIMVTWFVCSCSNQEKSLQETLSKGHWIDLSYDFSTETLYWPNNPTGFRLDTTAEGMTPGGFYYSTFKFSAPEHGGTHIDAPVHFVKNGLSVDKISLEKLTGEILVIDVSARALSNRDYLITANDIAAWEKEHGSIPRDVIVFFRTGHGKYYPNAGQYFGTAEKGDSAIPKLHFPGIDSTAAVWLAEHKIKAVGIDTPSIDFGQSKNFKTHQVLLGSGMPAFENVANMDQLPVKGAYAIALPMKIKNGSGGPLRLIAWLPGQ